MINEQGFYRIDLSLDNIHKRDKTGENNLDISIIGEEMEILWKHIVLLGEVQDKLKRRNTQIADLKARLKELKKEKDILRLICSNCGSKDISSKCNKCRNEF